MKQLHGLKTENKTVKVIDIEGLQKYSYTKMMYGLTFNVFHTIT